MSESDSSNPVGQSADLRTRIAAAVADYHQRWGIGCECGADHAHAFGVADAVIRELNLAKACEGGCVWQIPRHVEDMTPQQRELLGKPPLFGQHLAVGDDGPIMLNISPKEDDA